ncbi:hypothetical protein QZH41_020219, partial [Actinostola sp. cb2023]
DQQLLTKLSCGGDLVALEAKYHATCLAKLYRKAQTSSYDDNGEEKIVRPEGIALAELVAYIEESTLTIFKLADLAKAYKSRLEQLGVNMTARVNTTRLKERLLIHLPGLEDHNNGRDVYLAFKDDLGRMMEKAHQEDCDEEAIHLAKAASIVRKEMLAMKYSFDGSFDSDCQTKSVPESLLSLVNMILYGPNIEAQTNTTSSAQAQSRHVDRLDVVWDEYVENSLKATTRGNRGAGVRRRVAGTNRLPSNWKEFLRVDENKRELFKFLAECISNLDVQKQIITTYGDQVLCTLPRDTSSLAPCSHEEADTRMMLHVQDAVQHGYEKIMLRTVDTDVLILAVAVLSQLSEHARPELWLAFGTGNHLRYIAAHEISSSLGPQTSKALPVFHAFTGCDTVSCFGGRGKKTALEVWKLYPEVTAAFLLLAASPTAVSDTCMQHLERFVVLLYDRTSSKLTVNEARKQMFAQKGRALEAIPPSRAALVEHTKRAAYQAGYCWGQALKPRPVLPSPEKWGWTLSEGTWEPF